MKAKITWDAGWGETTMELTVAGTDEAVRLAGDMVQDAIDTNMHGSRYYDFMDALHEGGEVEVSVRVKSVEREWSDAKQMVGTD